MKKIYIVVVTSLLVLLFTNISIQNLSKQNNNITQETELLPIMEDEVVQTDVLANEPVKEEKTDLSNKEQKNQASRENKQDNNANKKTSSKEKKQIQKNKNSVKDKTSKTETNQTNKIVKKEEKVESLSSQEKPTTKKEVWEELGMTKDQYYNEPMQKWSRVDFNTLEECVSYAEANIEGKYYTCRDVVSASGRTLGFMLDVED